MTDTATDVPWFARSAPRVSADRPTFLALLERSRKLDAARFREQFPYPVLVSHVSFDPANWERALVLPVRREQASPTAPGATETIFVGRRRGIDVRLPSHSVSRDHAAFERRDGNWAIRDLGSANGTRLNGTTLAPNALATIARTPATIEFCREVRWVFFTSETLFDLIAQVRVHAPLDKALAHAAGKATPDSDAAAGAAAHEHVQTLLDGDPTDSFETAVLALESVGDMIRSLEVTVEGREAALELFARGGPVSYGDARSRLIDMRERVTGIRVRLGVGERKSIVLFARGR